jgi:hypothetical protein
MTRSRRRIFFGKSLHTICCPKSFAVLFGQQKNDCGIIKTILQNGNCLCSYSLIRFHRLLQQQPGSLKIRRIQNRTNTGIQFLLKLLGRGVPLYVRTVPQTVVP